MVNSNAPTMMIVTSKYSGLYRNVTNRLHLDSTAWQKFLMHTVSHMTPWK